MQRLINLSLLISFLLCYLEWGKTNHGFVFQLEYDMFSQGKGVISSFGHPLDLVPFCGQLLILYAVFQKAPNRRLTLIGLVLLSVLVLLILMVGLLSLNPRIAVSTVPFILISLFLLLYYRNSKSAKPEIL